MLRYKKTNLNVREILVLLYALILSLYVMAKIAFYDGREVTSFFSGARQIFRSYASPVKG